MSHHATFRPTVVGRRALPRTPDERHEFCVAAAVGICATLAIGSCSALLLLYPAAAIGGDGTAWRDEVTIGAIRFHADDSLAGEYERLQAAVAVQDEVAQRLNIDSLVDHSAMRSSGSPAATSGAPERANTASGGRLDGRHDLAFIAASAKAPTDVYLFGDRGVHEAYLKLHFPAIAYRRALLVSNGAQTAIFSFRNANLLVDLRHELVHALVRRVAPATPLWLDEGLAKYFEEPPPSRVAAEFRESAIAMATRGELPPLATLEAIDDPARFGKSEYLAALAWTTFLLDGPQPARSTFSSHFNNLQRSDRQRTLLSDELAMHFADPRAAACKRLAEAPR